MRTLTNRTLGRRTAGATLAAGVAVATLVGCGSDSEKASGSSTASSSPSASTSEIPKPKVVDGRIEATDGAFTVAVPDGWTSPERGVPAPFVLALQDGDTPETQLVASSFPEKGDAAETAQGSAAGITKQKATCRTGELGGKSIIDCAYDFQGKTVRKMFFPVEHGTGSVLVLFQTLAETRQAGYAQVEPVLKSWTWDDGSTF